MSVDIKKYLEQIPMSDWTKGNSSYSVNSVSCPYFLKRGPEKSCVVHNFFVSGAFNIKLGSMTPMFEGYCSLSESELQQFGFNANLEYTRVYAYEKINFVNLNEHLKNKSAKEYMPVLSEMSTFFHILDEAGIVYHDVIWDNLVWNTKTDTFYIFDTDSMEASTYLYSDLDRNNQGSIKFHTSFDKFREIYKYNNIKFLNICIYHTMFFAFVLGLAQNNSGYSLMDQSTAVNTLAGKYIEGIYTNKIENGNYIDKEYTDVLKEATNIVSLYIEGRYNGNPYTYMVSLVNGLVNKTPAKSVKQILVPIKPKPVPVANFTSNVTSGDAPLSVQFNDRSLRATGWKWDFGDGKSSTVQNPIHTYTAAGNYTVNLTASNAKGTNSTFGTINVSTKTIGQIITLALQQISSKISKASSKKILIPGIILCLFILAISSGSNRIDVNPSQKAETDQTKPLQNSDTSQNPSQAVKTDQSPEVTSNNSTPPLDIQQEVSPVLKDTDEASYATANELVIKGDELRGLGRYDEAIQAYDKVIEINSNNADAWNNKGLSLIILSRYDEAIQALDKAIEIKPNNAAAWSNKGSALDGLGRYDEAMQACDIAIENDPKLANALIVKGTVLHHLGRDDDALEAYDKAIVIDPKSAKAWINKGNSLGRLGRYDESIEALDKAIEIKPNNTDAWGNYAIAWDNKGISLTMLGRYDEAIKAFDKAIEIEPDNAWNNKGIANAWSNKGSALRHLGRYDEASICDEKATALESK